MASAAALIRLIKSGDLAGLHATLARSEANVQASDPQGRTPLHVACMLGSIDAVRELVKCKPPIDAADVAGCTPLHYACEQGAPAIVADLLVAVGTGRRMLLRRRNKAGNTALHVAAAGGHLAIVTALLEAGARNADAKDTVGRIPSDLVPPTCPDRDAILEAFTRADVAAATASRGSFLSSPSATSSSTPQRPASVSRTSVRTSLQADSFRALTRPPSATTPGTTPTSDPSPMPRLSARATTPDPGIVASPATTPTAHHPARMTPRASGVVGGIGPATAAVLDDIRAVADAAKERAAAAEESARQLAAQLADAQALIRVQAERMDVLESCLTAVEERAKEAQAAYKSEVETATSVRQRDQEQSMAQDAAIRSLAQRVNALQGGQDALATSVQRVSGDVNHLVATMPSRSQSQSQVDVAGTADKVAGLSARVDSLAGQLAALSGRAVSPADLEVLRGRINKWEALGVSDQLEVLSIRTQQLGSAVAALSVAHAETADRLTGWQAATSAERGSSAGAPPQTTQQQRDADAARDAEVAHQLATLQEKLVALQEQVVSLAAAARQAAAQPAAPPVAAPATPPTTPPGEVRASPYPSRRGTNSRPTQDDDVAAVVAELSRDVAMLKGQVEALRSELGVTVGSLRREWADAVEAAGQRHVERLQELDQREARVKAMRDSVFAEGDSRALVAALEVRLADTMAGIDTRLGLLQHKIEVVECQVAADNEPGSPGPTRSSAPTHRSSAPHTTPSSTPASKRGSRRSGPVAEDCHLPPPPLAQSLTATSSPSPAKLLWAHAVSDSSPARGSPIRSSPARPSPARSTSLQPAAAPTRSVRLGFKPSVALINPGLDWLGSLEGLGPMAGPRWAMRASGEPSSAAHNISGDNNARKVAVMTWEEVEPRAGLPNHWEEAEEEGEEAQEEGNEEEEEEQQGGGGGSSGGDGFGTLSAHIDTLQAFDSTEAVLGEPVRLVANPEASQLTEEQHQELQQLRLRRQAQVDDGSELPDSPLARRPIACTPVPGGCVCRVQ